MEAGNALVEELWKNQRQANLLFDLFDKIQLLNRQSAEKFVGIRLRGISTEKLLDSIQEALEFYNEMWELGPFAELIDFYLSAELRGGLLKEGVPEKDIAHIVSVLSTPEEESFSRKAEKSFLKIAAEIERRKLSLQKAFSDRAIVSMLEAHLSEYYWVSCNYFSFSGLGMSSLKKLVESALGKEKTALEKLSEFGSQQNSFLREKEALLKKYCFGKKTVFHFNLLQKVAVVYDDRKKSQMYSFYSVGRMLKELARRLKVNSDLAKYVLPQELSDFVSGKISSNDLYERRQYSFIDFNVLPPKILTGEAARKAEQELWKSSDLSQDEVNGTSASPGKIIARARVITSSKNLSELQKGEILVTGMTSPDYVPFLSKVVGMITDDGGITCHAAIIAREFGIPCIVGTKVATRAIKTGDLLDLRANHGLARIIERIEKIA